MTDLLLRYRACGAECRDDYLRGLANDNGLPLACVRSIADTLGEREDFRALVAICEERRARGSRLVHRSGQGSARGLAQ